MSVEGFKPVVIEAFGGRVTVQNNELETPLGYASDEANCDFLPGRVFKRPGFTLDTDVGDTVLSLDEYVNLVGERTILAMTDVGDLYKDTGATLIESAVNESSAGERSIGFVSTTLFGRQFLAFGVRSNLDLGIWGGAQPRHYNGTYLDRVSQIGPGAAPTLATTLGGGVTDAGIHYCRVFFKTRSGYWTAPSRAASITITAGQKIDVSNIPIGPSNVVGRVICFTPANETTNFYFIGGTDMEVADNTTTSVTGIDFADSALISGTPISSQTNPEEDLMDLIELPPQLGVISYKNRLAFFGGLDAIQKVGDTGFDNLTFDGGFNANTPLGWTQIAAGQSKTTQAGATGDVLKITGDGVNQKGRIQNNVSVLGVFEPGKEIRARVRAMLDPAAVPAAGTLHLFFTGATAPAADITIAVGSLNSTSWTTIDAQLLSAANNKPAKDWRLNLTSGGVGYGGTAITLNKAILIDRVDLYYGESPRSASLVLWSGVDDPESIDGLTGIMNVAENNGQAIRAGFVVRGNCYFVKERSLYVTNDNGSTEPDQWSVEEVSSSAGTPSPRGVATGDGWAIIAGRNGVNFFAGGKPTPISDEIRPDWDAVQWKYGDAIWVELDTQSKRIWIGVPYTAGVPHATHIFYCRYEGETPVDGKRSWSIWQTTEPLHGLNCRAAVFQETTDGEKNFLVSMDDIVASLDESARNDPNSTIINSYYKTAFVGDSWGRNLFGYLTMNVRGVGNLSVLCISPTGVTVPISSVILQNPFNKDVERILNVAGERHAFRFGTTNLDETWSMQKFVVFLNRKTGAIVRGNRGI